MHTLYFLTKGLPLSALEILWDYAVTFLLLKNKKNVIQSPLNPEQCMIILINSRLQTNADPFKLRLFKHVSSTGH